MVKRQHYHHRYRASPWIALIVVLCHPPHPRSCGESVDEMNRAPMDSESRSPGSEPPPQRNQQSLEMGFVVQPTSPLFLRQRVPSGTTGRNETAYPSSLGRKENAFCGNLPVQTRLCPRPISSPHPNQISWRCRTIPWIGKTSKICWRYCSLCISLFPLESRPWVMGPFGAEALALVSTNQSSGYGKEMNHALNLFQYNA